MVDHNVVYELLSLIVVSVIVGSSFDAWLGLDVHLVVVYIWVINIIHTVDIMNNEKCDIYMLMVIIKFLIISLMAITLTC